MKHRSIRETLLIPMISSALLAAVLFALAGCGGSSTTSPASTPAAPGTVSGPAATISGTATMGPVNGGMVTAYQVNNGGRGAQLASAATDAQGNFTMSFGGYSGPVMLSMSGGSYTDEATGSTMSMGASDVMSAMIPAVAPGAAVTGVQVTPLTSMAQSMASNMPGGMTPENMTTANLAMGRYFMVGDILHTSPMNPNVSGSGSTASQDMRNYGMAIAAMSEYARSLGMTSSSAMVTSMMNDASDGVMNGMMSGNRQVPMGGGMMGGSMMQGSAGTSALGNAMSAYMNSSMNMSGLTAADMQALINQLDTSSGTIR